jgi:hypothetical protein
MLYSPSVERYLDANKKYVLPPFQYNAHSLPWLADIAGDAFV